MTDIPGDEAFDAVVASANGAMVVVTTAAGEQPGGWSAATTSTSSPCGWEPGPDGIPLLRRCPNRLIVARTALLDDGGDHVAVSGRPIATHAVGEFTPLRFADVRNLVPGPEADDRPDSVPDHEHRGA